MRISRDASELARHVQSGHRVFVHEGVMAPLSLLEAVTQRACDLHRVEIVHLHTNAPAPYVAPSMAGHVRHNALFVGPNVREAVQAGRADFTPVFLSEVPSLFRDGTLPLDVALVQVSPPNAHGFCRLGVSVAAARAAVDHARVVLAEINPRVPRAHGHTALHVDRITAAIEVDRPLPEQPRAAIGEVERSIGRFVAEHVGDGATLQVGIGAVPDAVLAALASRSDLGIHTEMFSDGVLDLVRAGAVTGARKSRFAHRVVASFVMGTKALYDFCDDNPAVELHPSDVVNDATEISAQHAMTSINSALSIDLTGQVCADSIDGHVFSGIGGQMDFVRGATASPGGHAFIVLPSTAKQGTLSRIVPTLAPGDGVVTTRGHVEWVVTEHGAVDLRGRSLRERAEMLVSIAHPDFRHELRAAAIRRRLIPA